MVEAAGMSREGKVGQAVAVAVAFVLVSVLDQIEHSISASV